jgi:hypothetical protein
VNAFLNQRGYGMNNAKVKLVQSQYSNCQSCYYNRHLNGCAASNDEREACYSRVDEGENDIYIEVKDEQ